MIRIILIITHTDIMRPYYTAGAETKIIRLCLQGNVHRKKTKTVVGLGLL
jgi:hypothetical protein